MKTKTLASLEIAIVLCLVFLVALPTITAASELYEAGPLDVFGNANEDDTIDMRDTTYIKLAIFGKKPKTDLADANYDGKVSMLDVGQTKLIILGKEKKLTITDLFGEAVTVNKPIKRFVGLDRYYPEVTLMLDAVEILVGVGGHAETFSQMPSYYPETIRKLPAFGYGPPYDYEAILSLEPDAIGTNILVPPAGLEKKRILEEKLAGIPIFSLNVRNPDTFSKTLRIFGYIIDKEAEAEESIDWYEGCRNEIKSRTEGLSEYEKPRVYYEGTSPWNSICPGGRGDQMIALAGGKNIVDDIVGPDHPSYGSFGIDVDPEWVIEQNPDVIVKWGYPGKGYHGFDTTSYETDDTSGVAALRQEILDRPELANVDAVKNKRVYVLDGYSCGGGAGNPVIGTTYLAKMFYPDIMKGIDPQAVHQEYLDKLQIDFNVRKHGVFVYPPLEEWPV